MDNPWQSDSELEKLEAIGKTTGGRNPYQEEQYQQKLKQYGILPGEDYMGYVTRKQTEANMKAVQPAITSLEAGIPEVKDAYTKRQEQLTAEKQPLQDRYEQLLNEIRGRETSQVNETTRNVNREMGRRGITLDSTFAGDETLGRTAGIRSQAQSDILTTTFERESKLREIDNTITNLTSEMVAAERDIRNNIANIQATAGTQGVAQALQLYQIAQQERQAALDRALKERELNANIEAVKADTTVVEVDGRKKLIDNKTGAVIQDLGASSSGSSSGVNLFPTTTTSQQSTVKKSLDNSVISGSGSTYQFGGINLVGNQPNTLFTNPQNTVPQSKTSNPILKFSTLQL